MARRKKNKKLLFFIIVFMISITVYGALKTGEYAAKKLMKPIAEKINIFDNKPSDALGEGDMVTLAALTSEFIAAEHLKQNDKIAEIVEGSYYSKFISSIKSITAGDAIVQDINYMSVAKDEVKIQASFLKGSKKSAEVITFKNYNKVWKIVKVER